MLKIIVLHLVPLCVNWLIHWYIIQYPSLHLILHGMKRSTCTGSFSTWLVLQFHWAPPLCVQTPIKCRTNIETSGIELRVFVMHLSSIQQEYCLSFPTLVLIHMVKVMLYTIVIIKVHHTVRDKIHLKFCPNDSDNRLSYFADMLVLKR